MNPNGPKEKPKLLHVKNATCLYRQSHNGIYYFQGQINGKKYTQSLDTTHRATANRELRARREKLERLDYASGKMTLAALCERYKKMYQNQAPETVKQKDRIVKRIVDKKSDSGRI